MDLLKTTFEFNHKDAGRIIATIHPPGSIAGYGDVWVVHFYDWKKAQRYVSYAPEERGRQFVNQTRARQIVARVLTENNLKP